MQPTELISTQDDLSWILGGASTLQGLKLGDWIKITCKDVTIDPTLDKQRSFEGEVVSMFNAFDREGNDNWQIEIKAAGCWFLWKPVIDGGNFVITTPKTDKRRF